MAEGPGLRQVYGSAAHVCPDCDGYDTRGKKVVVIASGRKAAGMALNLTTWTSDIVICTNGSAPDLDADQCAKLDALNIPVLSARIERVVPQGDRIYSLELEGGMHLDCDHLFFALSQRPADDLGAQLECERDDDGQIVVDEHQQTSVRERMGRRRHHAGPAAGDRRGGRRVRWRPSRFTRASCLTKRRARAAAAPYQRRDSDCSLFFRMIRSVSSVSSARLDRALNRQRRRHRASAHATR